ncbi:MAG: phosphoribosylformylglycinamidine synthase I [Spirochaetes bacterium]|nr:phosphoribosylformylglycinamidine synthase I [Spirochaetota bacterium]
MKPKALILHAAGTNRDGDAAYALGLAGAEPMIVHLNELKENRRLLSESSILVLPGGFSYADALGAGRLFALDLTSFFGEEVQSFVASGKPVIGICNGFQTLVKAGILPGEGVLDGIAAEERWASLADNQAGRFECRWVSLKAQRNGCLWTDGIEKILTCPVTHGEGRFLTKTSAQAEALLDKGLIALTYVKPDGSSSDGIYPDNPNGSVLDIAGICNLKGNVLGLMPHPEDNSGPEVRAFRNGRPGDCLALFENGVRYAKQS